MLYDILGFILRVILGIAIAIIAFMVIITLLCLLPLVVVVTGIFSLWVFVLDR